MQSAHWSASLHDCLQLRLRHKPLLSHQLFTGLMGFRLLHCQELAPHNWKIYFGRRGKSEVVYIRLTDILGGSKTVPFASRGKHKHCPLKSNQTQHSHNWHLNMSVNIVIFFPDRVHYSVQQLSMPHHALFALFSHCDNHSIYSRQLWFMSTICHTLALNSISHEWLIVRHALKQHNSTAFASRKL